MKLIVIAKYIVVYLILNIIGFYIASKYWFTDSFTLSFLNKETILLLISVGFCWIGILYISILTIRNFIINLNTQNFIGPIDLVTNQMFQKEIGEKQAVKFKNYLTFTAFPILFLTIIGFRTSANFFEKYQLKKYGKTEIVSIEEIRKDMKQNPYIFFEYNTKFKTNLPNTKNLKVGHTIEIIYSAENPEIIDYKTE